MNAFNDAIKHNSSMDEVNNILKELTMRMPCKPEEMNHVFHFMVMQGVIMSISLLIKRINIEANTDLTVILSFPLTSLQSNVLWLLEDFSAGKSPEVSAILDTGIVAR